MSENATIVWLRLDLRIEDNPALVAAERRGGAVVPVFVWSPRDEEPWAPGAAGRWWLHQSLAALQKDLVERESRLVVRTGDPMEVLSELIRTTEAGAVFWNRRYEPRIIERDKRIMRSLKQDGVDARSFNASLLFEPWNVATGKGGPYKVYTPFYRACMRGPAPAEPESAPRELTAPAAWPRSKDLVRLGLEPKIDWAEGLRAAWTPGERGARRELSRFLEHHVAAYPDGRDRPDLDGTSRLSPHLHFGEISPRVVWHAASAHAGTGGGKGLVQGTEGWLRQLVWREFAHHLLYHFPHTTDLPLREEFSAFPWKDDPEALAAWQEGRTGYPVVDAGMRQLWQTGWMHNRVRMIVASFLVKDLLIPWQKGARWFWDTLVDADLANNTLGWQWTAGCGADAAPYFRVFNPMTQGARYDPGGDYVRRYVPELAGLAQRYLNEPWKAPAETLAAAGVRLGSSYPAPMVDHHEAREEALGAYDRIRGR